MMVVNYFFIIIPMAYIYSSFFEENFFLSAFKFLVSFVMSYVVLILAVSILIVIVALIAKSMGHDLFPKPEEAETAYYLIKENLNLSRT